jgi:hypothetical protein
VRKDPEPGNHEGFIGCAVGCDGQSTGMGVLAVEPVMLCVPSVAHFLYYGSVAVQPAPVLVAIKSGSECTGWRLRALKRITRVHRQTLCSSTSLGLRRKSCVAISAANYVSCSPTSKALVSGQGMEEQAVSLRMHMLPGHGYP